jgi:uncharacterized phage protein (TIGR02220 family)
LKNTIAGFNQEYALTLRKTVPGKGGVPKTIKIDCTDLTILRWLVDFYPSMKKKIVDDKEYVWLTHKKLMEDLPLLDITKRSCIDRMQKLVEFGILDYKLLKAGGTFSLYTFGENYMHLVQSTNIGVCSQPTQGDAANQQEGMQSTNTRVFGQPDNKDNSVIDNSFLDICKYIVGHLNEKAGTKYKASSKETQKLIHARMADGYTVEDFVAVIDKKCTQWKGDAKMQEYLRPSTLFGTKFEGYLNAPATAPQPARPAGRGGYPGTVGPNGIAIDPAGTNVDAIF